MKSRLIGRLATTLGLTSLIAITPSPDTPTRTTHPVERRTPAYRRSPAKPPKYNKRDHFPATKAQQAATIEKARQRRQNRRMRNLHGMLASSGHNMHIDAHARQYAKLYGTGWTPSFSG